MPLPLHCRVPRPPPIFVGRQDELAWLRTALDRGSVAVINGWAGIGKSALVAAWCAESGFDNFVCVRAEGVRSVYAQLCALWGEGADANDIDGCTFGVIEGLERHQHHLVVEDTHGFVRPDELARLVSTFSRFHSGQSRLLTIGRVRLPVPEIAEQALWLGPLPDDQVADLIRRCATSDSNERVEAMVRAAHGSPFEARRLVDGAPAATPAQLFQLPPTALALASVLARVDRLPVFAVGESIANSPALLAELRLIDRDRELVRMPDAHRPLFASEAPGMAEVAGAVADSLIESRVQEWRWTALQLACMARRIDLVDELLSAADEGFVDLIGSQRLFDTLADISSDEALRMRLLCVYSSPWQAGLTWLAGLDGAVGPRSQLAYSQALFAANEIARAESVLHALTASDVDAVTRLEASIGLVKIADEHRLPDLERQLTELDLALEGDRMRRDVWLAYVRYRLEDRRTGQALVRAVFAKRHRLGPNRQAIARELYGVLVFLSMFSDARKLAEEEGITQRLSPRWAYFSAVVAVETCSGSDRVRQVARLEPVAAGSMRYEFLVGYLEERHAQHVDLPLARGALTRMWAVAEALGDTRFLADCRLYELELSLYSAKRPHARLLAAHAPHAALVSLVRLRMDGDDPGAPAEPQQAVWQTVLCAERAFLRGDFESAMAILDAGVLEAHGRQAMLEAADLRAAQGHLLLRWPDLDRARAMQVVSRIHQLAEAHGLAELAALAKGVELLTETTRPSEEVLRLLGDRPSLIGRVARVLLGEEQADWKSDRDALANLTRRWARTASPEPALLELDPEAFTARASGSTLELANHRLLFQILDLLARAPKGASKERLAREVWSVASYRPDRDDKRIQVAIARLRSLIARVRFPVSIVTTPTGYCVAGNADAA